ncbi:hypothetical protein RVO90_22915 [Enterobacter chengduensis]|uniref:phage baseplate plug family protein n=1 Tax=Enterobacter chengduensis TaxID=2494701 RepID=UPI000649707C|nr:hypothetical protein [Enterobacter chengduensis]EFC2021210.1 hypothetical protein [Escherichia coli]KVK39170.1 hypothetical protein ABF69_0209350 [Enterobacter chengduensis]MDV0368794.1 hypothetical protein [Enterobacter chengduensis]PNL54050.1 hypothetical protein CEP65_015030 [Enterobacter hormaechei]
MQGYEIPLTPDNQYFQVTLGGVNYSLRIVWREVAGWIMDVSDKTGEPILTGVPLIPDINLLDQYPELGVSGQLVVLADNGAPEYPSEDNLGSSSHLIFIQE